MFERELADLERAGLLRRTVTVGPRSASRVLVDGREVVLCCSNDYLDLSRHPALISAARSALERYGTGSGASRLISGTTPLHEELERRIAAFKGTEEAVLFNSGYAANTGIIPALARDGDVIFSDSLNHASIIDGCRLSRAEVRIYRHGDVRHLKELLAKTPAGTRRLIVTDGVFSMDGDITPLPDLADLADRYEAILMVDDAHATGVLGARGKGTEEHFGLSGRVRIQMGTLGKALGSFGAYAAVDGNTADYLRNRARSYIYSTALPPAVCAASIAALDVLEHEPERRSLLAERRQALIRGMEEREIPVADHGTPIIPVMIGDAGRAVKASQRLFELGIFATAIRPPTVLEGSARIRLTVTSGHSEEDLSFVLAAMASIKNEGLL